jgi:RNA polymerase sigma-70 factor (ECF subfamily)
MRVNEDRELVQKLNHGDLSAFNSLFKKYAESIYAFSLSITKEPYIAEEITQQVFIKVWEKRDTIKEHLSFKSFIFSICYSETISWLRKDKSEKRKVNSYGNESSFSTNETLHTVEFRDVEIMALQFIELLPNKRKEIFKLSRNQGYSNKEIAEKLGISVKTVENQMTVALRTLKEKLADIGILGLLYFFVFFL